MLTVSEIKKLLEEYGAKKEHEVKHKIRYWLNNINEYVYLNKDAGKRQSGLIIHPKYRPARDKMLHLQGLESDRAIYHSSSMSEFPKRYHGGQNPISYGVPFGFDSKSALFQFLDCLKDEKYKIEKNIFFDIEDASKELAGLSETVKKSIINSRIGQGKFREDLIGLWGKCCVTGCSSISMLRASHIKPWSDSSNTERLDKFNGLLLVPNLDLAFDQGYISFDDSGKIIISSYLNSSSQKILNISNKLKMSKIDTKHINYLKYHRNIIFK